MKIHFAGATNQTVDEMITSKTFSRSIQNRYTIESKKLGFDFEIYGGMKTYLMPIKQTFDLGKNRDSNFVYGPSLPRTVFFRA
jgi:outer membrane receptor for ferrienterochelin and colicins